MVKPTITFEAIDYIRSGKRILSNINWQVHQGEQWIVFGPNGSGKTSIIQLLMGHEWPHRGQVSFEGARYGDGAFLPGIRKSIGYVSSALLQRISPYLKVSDVVLSGLDATLRTYRNYNEEEIDSAYSLMKEFGLQNMSDQCFGVCSQGEKQRAVICRSLVSSPKVLILDEACAGLDPAQREHLLQDIKSLLARKPQVILIYITHHLEETTEIGTHAMALNEGRIVSSGIRNDVLSKRTFREVFGISAPFYLNQILT